MLGKSVEFRAGGKLHELRLNNRALRTIEAHFGCSAREFGDRLKATESITDVTDLVRILLGEGYELDDVDAIIDELGYERLGALVNEAIGEAMPQGAPAKN